MSAFDSIVRGLNEAIEYEKGNLKEARAHTISIAPLPLYNAPDIKRIRTQLNLSQFAFANIIGVSQKTVEAWERGRNIPKGASLRMLEMLDENGQDMVKRYIAQQ